MGNSKSDKTNYKTNNKTNSNNNNNQLIIIGDKNVGKTSIITRFINNQFNDYKISFVDSYKYTINLNNNQDFKLKIWDVFGKERFKKFIKKFYQDCVIVILVYDITSKESFENIKNIYWKEIKTYDQKSCKSK